MTRLSTPAAEVGWRLPSFLLFAAALLVVGPAEASRTTDARSGLAAIPAATLAPSSMHELVPLELASLELSLLEPLAPVDTSPRFGFGEDLGLLDPERGPGGFVVFARETSRCELTYARNNPLKYVDPDGNSATLAGAAVGGLVSGSVALFQGRPWREVGAAAAGGAVAGAMYGSVIDTGGASLGVLIAAGAFSGAAGGATERLLLGEASTPGDVARDASAGAAGVMLGATAASAADSALTRAVVRGEASASQNVEKLLANPQQLSGKSPGEVGKTVASAPGWRAETLGQGAHKGQGWVFREYQNGQATGRQLRWHPGGGHHGPDPYWRVVRTTGPSEIIR